jgi:hypothetical protein
MYFTKKVEDGVDLNDSAGGRIGTLPAEMATGLATAKACYVEDYGHRVVAKVGIGRSRKTRAPLMVVAAFRDGKRIAGAAVYAVFAEGGPVTAMDPDRIKGVDARVWAIEVFGLDVVDEGWMRRQVYLPKAELDETGYRLKAEIERREGERYAANATLKSGAEGEPNAMRDTPVDSLLFAAKGGNEDARAELVRRGVVQPKGGVSCRA